MRRNSEAVAQLIADKADLLMNLPETDSEKAQEVSTQTQQTVNSSLSQLADQER